MVANAFVILLLVALPVYWALLILKMMLETCHGR